MGSVDEEQRFEEMYGRCYPAVLSFCRRRLPADAARDAAADVFLVAWRRFDELLDPPLPWLIATATLTVRSCSRGETRQARLASRIETVDPPADVSDHADRVAERHRVAKALGLLAESDRALLLMDAWDDLGTAAMSAVLGCSRAAVRVRLLRARRRLARALDDHSVAVPKAPSAATAHPALRCKEKT